MTQSHVAPESTAQAEAPRGDVTVQPGEVATTVAELPDQLRREIVAARENGATLAELKRDFGRQVAADVIREVLPPGNARERRAREARQSKADQPKPELSKRAQDAVADAKAKPQAAPRYVTDEQVIEELASGITACRERGVGRARLAELAGTIPMVPTAPRCSAASSPTRSSRSARSSRRWPPTRRSAASRAAAAEAPPRPTWRRASTPW